MNTIYEFDFKSKHYELKVNNKVRMAINDLKKSRGKMLLSSDAIEALKSVDFKDMLNKDEDDIQDLDKLIPLLPFFNEFDAIELDPYEVFYVTLHANYPDVSKEMFEKIVEELEEHEGVEELCSIVANVNDKVFTQVEKMENLLHKA